MARRLYRLLLWSLPRRFRRAHGESMAAAFHDALQDARARRGNRGVVDAWRLALVDLAATFFAVWRDSARRLLSPAARRAGGASPRRPLPGRPSFPDRRCRPGRSSLPGLRSLPDRPSLPLPDRAPMSSFLQDVKYSLRSLRSAPGFLAVAVLTLALGIGAVTAIFSVVHAVLLQPLPYDNPDELVVLWSRNPEQGQERYFVSPQDFHSWRTQSSAFEQMAGFWPTHHTLTSPDHEAERLRSTMVSGEFFDLLGARPFRGRTLRREDEGEDAGFVVVLSHSLWRNRLNGDETIVGRALTLDGASYEVVGVTEPGFELPEGTELWMNMPWDMATVQSRYARWMTVIGRLGPDATVQDARADMEVVTARLAQAYPSTNEGWSATMAPLHQATVGDADTALIVLLGATGLILLIACANVANLQLSRAETRQREVAVRSALGADRGRIGRQLLTESTVLAGLGAAFGLLAAWASVRLLVALSPADLPRIEQVGINGAVLLFASTSTIATGILFGLAPALRLARTDMTETLEGAKSSASSGRLRLRNALVVVEVALAVMLVTGAGLLIRSFGNLRAFDPGFNAGGVLTLMLDLPGGSYGDDAQVANFYQRLEERLAAIPGVQGASVTSTLPLDESVDYYASFTIVDREPPPPGEQHQAYFRQVGHDFFRVMGMQLRAGRAFTEADRADAPGVVIINETLARQYWPDGNPLGERLTDTYDRFGPLGVMLHDEVEIVGVVEDVRYVGLRESPQPSLYFPYRQAPFRRMTVVVRTGDDPQALASSIRAGVRGLDADLPVTRVATMEQVLGRSVAQDRFSTLLLLLFGASALLLAAVGIYGVLSYNVEQRTRELGIRMALGAAGSEVRGLVLRQALVMIGLGISAGLVAALALSRVLESQLFGVGARDPLTFAGVAVLLATIAFAASYLPARRATSVDPVVALRNE